MTQVRVSLSDTDDKGPPGSVFDGSITFEDVEQYPDAYIPAWAVDVHTTWTGHREYVVDIGWASV